jgi:hypothetical protein
MTLTDFFSLVLPSKGTYCFAAIQGKKIEQVFLEDITDLVSITDAISGPVNQYYALASFKESGKRTQANVAKLKSFWLDIDVGKGTEDCYDTQDQAYDAIKIFLTTTELPTPILVNSGNGVHVYWPLDRELDSEIWKPIATRLQALAVKHNLKVDSSCTTDSARILRYPNSLNYRDASNPKPTGITQTFDLTDYQPVNLISFASKLGLGSANSAQASEESDGLPFDIPEHIKHIDDNVTKQIVGVTVFKLILENPTPCAQIQYIKDNQATLPEPLWRAGLSIAQICTDRAEAIHTISDKHPSYTHAATEDKANQTKGPYTCQSFEKLEPSRCVGCVHRGKLSTPAQLGRYVAPAVSEEDRTVFDIVHEPVVPLSIVTDIELPQEDVILNIDCTISLDDVAASVAPTKITTVIPEYPSPYFRPKGGVGVYKTVKSPGEADITVPVYEYDFYVTRRMRDPDVGEVLWFRLHLPLDGIREFCIPFTDIVSRDKFRDALAMQGVMTTGTNQVTELLNYVSKWVRHLQTTVQAEKVRSQMGWTEDGTFVVGARELIPGQPLGQDVIIAPAASRSAKVVELLTERGDFHRWKEVINFYANDDMEPYAFALFLSFGAPLMQFTPLRGGVYNLMSNGSGVGKSSALLAANSIWGHPSDLLMQKDDTYNARIHRAGIMRHLPVTIDEITNMRPTDMSDQIYASTSGRGKNRMESHVNAERSNHTTWQTPTLTTSNSSVADKLHSNKAFPEGELMRLIEIEVKRNTKFPKSYTDMLFPQLETNHGMAWLPYMRYVTNHQQEVIHILRTTQEKTDLTANLTQRERVWSSMAAIALTGGTIAHSLGLHNIDVGNVARWVSAHMFKAASQITTAKYEVSDTIAAYMGANYSNILIINNSPAHEGMPVVATLEPRSELLIRWEPDTKRIFIATAPFKKWCSDSQISFSSILDSLNKDGLHAEMIKKRMGKGLPYSIPPVMTIMIQVPDNATGSMFGLDDMDASDASAKKDTEV